uniref:Uncharacterized protein n=1 Tax=Solanum lycopersicum TaxID=4081 RepID=A0A3Q7FGF6_SOLLC
MGARKERRVKYGFLKANFADLFLSCG